MCRKGERACKTYLKIELRSRSAPTSDSASHWGIGFWSRWWLLLPLPLPPWSWRLHLLCLPLRDRVLISDLDGFLSLCFPLKVRVLIPTLPLLPIEGSDLRPSDGSIFLPLRDRVCSLCLPLKDRILIPGEGSRSSWSRPFPQWEAEAGTDRDLNSILKRLGTLRPRLL